MKFSFILILLTFSTSIFAVQPRGSADCCLAKNNKIGVDCSEKGIEYKGNYYFCVEVTESCPYCIVKPYFSSSDCYQCCAMGPDYCQLGHLTDSSWKILLIIFSGSCFICAILFLAAEEDRLKEGISFEEAYFIPIPLVEAEVDFEGREHLFPPDSAEVVATEHTSLDIPVAEPAETYPLISGRIFER